ncbi:MAG: ABC-F family ATP-binding cassette domain-containing protein [Bacteroidota bacterium]
MGVNYVSAQNLSKSFGVKQLFEGLSFGIDEGQKIALIGLNGSGKSTLLKILAGLETPDTGNISFRKGLQVGFLAQAPKLPPEKTIGEIVFDPSHPIQQLILRYEQLLSIVEPSSEESEALESIIAKMESAQAWEYEVNIKQILSRLNVHLLDTPFGVLSGGQQKRVALAQLLIQRPDLIIMDEPTNHLDMDTIEWLEKYLSTSKQSLFLVTHDRYFLDSITQEIYELDQGRLYTYQGSYAYYLEKKSEREKTAKIEQEKAKSLYAKELEWLRRSPKARGTKSKSRIQAADTLKDQAQNRQADQQVQLQIKGRRIGGKVMEIKKLRKAYGDKVLIEDFTYTFNRQDRVGVIGPNGAGKTTFIKLLTEELAPDSGKVRKGDTIYFGHYTQAGLNFKPEQRVIDVVREVAEEVELSKSERVSASQLLEHFLFPHAMHQAKVSTLSGGERRRLHLLRILMSNPNFLILDEPTNDLDLITLRKLEEFLHSFEGCLLIVSHDRYFMDRLVDHLFVFEGAGEIKDYPGSYSQYRTTKLTQTSPTKREEADKQQKAVARKREKEAKKKNKLSFNEKREFEQLEIAIETLETQKIELLTQINGGEQDYEKLTTLSQNLEKLEEELEKRSDRWLELAERAEE